MLLCISVILTGCYTKEEEKHLRDTGVYFETIYDKLNVHDYLVYDRATKIVYMDCYTYCGYYVKCPYYAPNGKPYKYNEETNQLEEIK